MKNETKLILGTLCVVLVAGGARILHEVLNKPMNFRTSSSAVKPLRVLTDSARCTSINRRGLENANFSGGGALVLKHLKTLQESLPGSLSIVNGITGLTQVSYLHGRTLYSQHWEYDGQYLSQHPQRWAPLSCLKRLAMGTPLTVSDLDVSQVLDESEITEALGIGYAHPLPQDFTSDWSYIDDVVAIFDQTDPQHTHVLFHCTRGQGRTTLLMVLYDIYNNHNRVFLEDILDRQYCLGGEDLMDTAYREAGTWKQESLVNRKNMAYAFYDYMNDPMGYLYQKWSDWLDMKKSEGYAFAPIETDQVGPYRNGNV